MRSSYDVYTNNPMSVTHPIRTLLVDDSPFMLAAIEQSLSPTYFEVVGKASGGEHALTLLRSTAPELVLLDNIMPDMLGLEVFRKMKAIDPSVKAIMLSAIGQQAIKDQGIQLGLLGYLTKPFEAEELEKAILDLVR